MDFDIATLFPPVTDSRVESSTEETHDVGDTPEVDSVPKELFKWRDELTTKNILLVGGALLLLVIGGYSVYYNHAKGKKDGHSHTGEATDAHAGSGT